MPREKSMLSAILFFRSVCNLHSTGSGSTRMARSVTMLGAEIAMVIVVGLRQ